MTENNLAYFLYHMADCQDIAFEENKYNSKVTAFRFRDKKQGWKLHGSMTFDTNETIYFEPENSSYYQLFLNSYTYRENCYSCPYASEHRPGDITIGDFWGYEKIMPEIDESKGISLLNVNSSKGNIYITSIEGDRFNLKSNLSKYIAFTELLTTNNFLFLPI